MHWVIGFLLDMYRYGSDYFFATSYINHTHSVCLISQHFKLLFSVLQI